MMGYSIENHQSNLDQTMAHYSTNPTLPKKQRPPKAAASSTTPINQRLKKRTLVVHNPKGQKTQAAAQKPLFHKPAIAISSKINSKTQSASLFNQLNTGSTQAILKTTDTINPEQPLSVKKTKESFFVLAQPNKTPQIRQANIEHIETGICCTMLVLTGLFCLRRQPQKQKLANKKHARRH